mgnify:CR=1 FL=1
MQEKNDKIDELKQSAINAQQLEADKEIISSVRNSIEGGITSKAAIIKFVNHVSLQRGNTLGYNRYFRCTKYPFNLTTESVYLRK